jgi:hypothetical protein
MGHRGRGPRRLLASFLFERPLSISRDATTTSVFQCRLRHCKVQQLGSGRMTPYWLCGSGGPSSLRPSMLHCTYRSRRSTILPSSTVTAIGKVVPSRMRSHSPRLCHSVVPVKRTSTSSVSPLSSTDTISAVQSRLRTRSVGDPASSKKVASSATSDAAVVASDALTASMNLPEHGLRVERRRAAGGPAARRQAQQRRCND